MVSNLLALALLAAPCDSCVYHGSAGQLEVELPRVEDARVRIDGRLDEAVWQRAAVLDGFTQYDPVEGAAAGEATEVRVFYGPEAIYFGVRAYDGVPAGVRATRSERDRSIFNDDWVRIMLDTYDDRRQAYVFYVNPLGIQTDGLWLEGGETRRGGAGVPIDFNPDFLWQSRGRVDDEGWTAEIRIPYTSLRFRDGIVQSWGLNIAREVKRTGHKQSWAPLRRDQASTLAQSGRLVGLRGLRPRRLMELNPVLTGRRTGERLDGGELAYGALERDMGLNGRYGLTQNLTLSATYNPDFSQVESDAEQITVNERFALFLSEKRPFFLEGAEVFQTPQRLVHTRAIVDPIAGAKITGKVGAFNVGYLGALDDSPDDDGAGRAVFNLLRARRDIGAGSTLGLLATDRSRSAGDAFNRVLALDGRFLLGASTTVTAQAAGSWSGGETRGDTGAGALLHAEIARRGRNFSWELRAQDVTPGFRAGSGFIRRTDYAQLFASGGYTVYGRSGALLERASLEVRSENSFGHDELWRARAPEEREVEVQGGLSFRGRHSFHFIARDGHFRFRPDDFAGYAVEMPGGETRPFAAPEPLDHMLAIMVMPRVQPAQWLSVNGRYAVRQLPIYREASLGRELLLSQDARVNTSAGLNLEASFTRSMIRRERDETLYSTQNVMRLKAQYQLARHLLARAVTQLNRSESDALRDPATGTPLRIRDRASSPSEKGDVGLQLLLSYEPSPGTVFYVGWARQMIDPLANSRFRIRELEPTADGLFIKMSYLHRL